VSPRKPQLIVSKIEAKPANHANIRIRKSFVGFAGSGVVLHRPFPVAVEPGVDLTYQPVFAADFVVLRPDAPADEDVGPEFCHFSGDAVHEEPGRLSWPRRDGDASDRAGELRRCAFEGFTEHVAKKAGECGELFPGAVDASVALDGLPPCGGEVVLGAGLLGDCFGAAPGVVAWAWAGCGCVVVHGGSSAAGAGSMVTLG